MDKAKNRNIEKDIYYESHHITPKCMGGPDTPTNLVSLTAEEHFVAHQLLVKIWPGNNKLVSALSKMCSWSKKNPRNNKRYGWIRRKFIEANSGTNNSNSHLNNEQVIEIYHSNEDPAILCDKYNISRYNITTIKRKIYYRNILTDIDVMPGFYTDGKTTRLPIPIDFIEKIFYDTGDYAHFWNTYRATERVVKGIKDKKTFRAITYKLGTPGQVKRYGMDRDTIEEVFNAKGTNKDIAEQFGIHYNTVRNIKGKNSRAWSMWEEY